jgi:hypothetical protein
LTGLKKLHLHGNPISEDQQEIIDKALPKCTIYR